jgi:DNA (cytosine-5)-methyltransferase 1
MSDLTAVSLCSGYEGLGMGVMAVLGGRLVAVADNDPGAAAILAHRYPEVPNLGDITETGWGAVGPVGVLCAGFPCQDVSCAGARRGLREGTRTGVWAHVARAISALRPPLVVLENVRGMLSAGADSDVEPCPGCMGETGDELALRASGAVLGDLADLGYGSVWAVVSAADAGAPHRRERVFILAWPAADTDGRRWGPEPGQPRRRGSGRLRAEGRSPQPPAYAERDGLQGNRAAAGPRAGWQAEASIGRRPAVGGQPAENTDRPAGGEWGLTAPGQETRRGARADTGRPGGTRTAPDADSARLGGLAELNPPAAGWLNGTHRGHPDRRSDGSDWGPYAGAIHRWEQVLGRPAPSPTEPGRTGPRLSPRFVEWLMGLPQGWVTEVPGLSRNAQLKALGNGCVPQQVALALSLLLPHVPAEALAFLEAAA